MILWKLNLSNIFIWKISDTYFEDLKTSIRWWKKFWKCYVRSSVEKNKIRKKLMSSSRQLAKYISKISLHEEINKMKVQYWWRRISKKIKMLPEIKAWNFVTLATSKMSLNEKHEKYELKKMKNYSEIFAK